VTQCARPPQGTPKRVVVTNESRMSPPAYTAHTNGSYHGLPSHSLYRVDLVLPCSIYNGMLKRLHMISTTSSSEPALFKILTTSYSVRSWWHLPQGNSNGIFSVVIFTII